MKIKIINYDPNIDSLEELNKLVKESYEKNKSFFNKKIPTINYRFLYSRKEMDDLFNRKTQDWVVGTARGGIVSMFSPSIYDKVSNHSKKGFLFTLIHETTHIFVMHLFTFKTPIWLWEGIPGYIAEQFFREKTLLEKGIQSFEKLHYRKDWNKTTNYNQAFSFTKYLITKFGKDKILSFASKLGEKDSFNVFSEKFNQFFDQTINDVKENWIKELKLKYSK